MLGLKFLKKVVARAEIPKKMWLLGLKIIKRWLLGLKFLKRWLLGLKFLKKNVVARAEIPKNGGC